MTPKLCTTPYTGNLNEVCSSSRLGLFMVIINSFINLRFYQAQFSDNYVPATDYDFIVVGGGATGSVVASRLSENPDWSVLLLEAGPEEPLGALVPSMVMSFLGTDLDWQYKTTNEPNACLSTGGSCKWPRGKTLGGCTVHNGAMYTRGHPKDYDNWKVPGWSWKDVFPYFIKAENNKEIKRLNSSYHGTGGPLVVQRFNWQPPITQAILDAAQELGYSINDDLAGEQISGFAVAQANTENGLRVSSATAYLRPVRYRKNLHVLVNATVTEILTFGKKAVGVKYFMNGKLHVRMVKKEVIVSGGTINSPQLLLLSGIGPEKHLLEKKVPVVMNLPGVGLNLQNHVSFDILFTISDLETTWEQDVKEFLQTRGGPLSSTGLSQVTGILNSKLTTPDHPDIQLFFGGYVSRCSSNSIGSATRSFSIRPVYMHIESRGSIRLATNNPFDHPIITQNYLTKEKDIQGLLEAIKVGHALSQTKAMQKYNMSLVRRKDDACKQHKFNTEEYWRCDMAQHTVPENHQVGSCKMGAPWDPYSVVDNRLKVHGMRGLRVADLSILPRVISGNTAAPAMMIGERAADLIKEDWGMIKYTELN